jgi:hypothetical protein
MNQGIDSNPAVLFVLMSVFFTHEKEDFHQALHRGSRHAI